MISAATKACYLRASVQAIGSGIKPVASAVPPKVSGTVRPNSAPLTSHALSKAVPSTGNVRVTTGVPGMVL